MEDTLRIRVRAISGAGKWLVEKNVSLEIMGLRASSQALAF